MSTRFSPAGLATVDNLVILDVSDKALEMGSLGTASV